MASRQATHLGKKKLFESVTGAGQRRARFWFIAENLHGLAFVEMVASLFAGGARENRSIVDLDLTAIDWERSNGSKRSRPEQNHGNQQRDGVSNTGNRRPKRRKTPRNENVARHRPEITPK